MPVACVSTSVRTAGKRPEANKDWSRLGATLGGTLLMTQHEAILRNGTSWAIVALYVN